MSRLIEYSNSVSFRTDSNDDDLVRQAVEVFRERIGTHKPKTLKQTRNTIFYTAGMMRLVLNVNLLYGISEGEIRIEKRAGTLDIHYVIRFYEWIAVSIIAAVAALVIVDSIEGKILGLLLVMCISYGGNVLVTILRYKRFIRNTMKDFLSEKNAVLIGDEQKEWISNINKCDGCGFMLSPDDNHCPDCGLSLR
jgi:hypothetical protein